MVIHGQGEILSMSDRLEVDKFICKCSILNDNNDVDDYGNANNSDV